MPKIFRVYMIQCAIGFAVAGVFTAAILWFNVANLWHLVTHSDVGLLAIIVFWVLNGIVFGGVQFAIYIMLGAEPQDKGPRGGLREPVLVKVATERRNDGPATTF